MESVNQEDIDRENYGYADENPLNQKWVHEIIVHEDNEQTKDFTGLVTPAFLGKMLNKRLKCVQSFKKPEIDYAKLGKLKKPDDDIYYNTYRNGFVSAIAMSYNYHMPLILSPNDVWLAVMQGFRIFMRINKDKEFMKIVFKDMEKVASNTSKYFKMKDETITELEDMDSLQFE